MSHELGNGETDKNYQPSGISRAEEAAWEAYPDFPATDGGYVSQRKVRNFFIKGYEQAMKDLGLNPVDECLLKMAPCAKERYKLLVCIAEDVWGYKLTRNKSYDDTRIRMFVSFRMKREGYSVSEIGKAMGRHHASIINQVRKMENVFDEPVFYAEEYAKYAMFEDIINNYDGKRNEDNLAGD